MNRIKSILLLLAFFSFVGCKTSKLEKLEIRTDSTVAIKTTEQRPPLLDRLTIYDICDTATAKPVKFRKEFAVNKDTFFVEVVDNDLVMSLKLAQEIISKQDSLIKIKDSQTSKSKTITEYKTPKWAWATIGLLALFVALPKIPKFINTTARKLFL